jgi:hypothetical protein
VGVIQGKGANNLPDNHWAENKAAEEKKNQFKTKKKNKLKEKEEEEEESIIDIYEE